jgi:neutral trehalase
VIVFLAVLFTVIVPDFGWAQTPLCATAVPPSEQLGDLFELVQLSEIFPDGKTFTDLVPDEEPLRSLLTMKRPGMNLASISARLFINTSPPRVKGRPFTPLRLMNGS